MSNMTVLSYTADPSLASVLLLLLLGILGAFFHLTLFLAALADLKQSGVLGLPAPLSCTLAHLAVTGLIESTLAVSLSAFYASGGLVSDKDSSVAGKAVLLGALLFTGATHAWGMAGVLLSSLSNFSAMQRLPGSGLDKVRVLFVLVFAVCAALSVTLLVVLVRNKNAISSTPVVPRVKVLNIDQPLRHVITVLGFGAPWVLTALGFALHGKISLQNTMTGFLPPTSSPPLTASRFVLLAALLALYLLLRAPFDLGCLISGARPLSLHASLAWCRFCHLPLGPLVALLSLGRLKSTLGTLLRCLPRSRAVSPPAPLRMMPSIRVNSVQLMTPIIFPTPGGLYLRLSRHLATSGFSYRACDVTSDVPYSKAQLERRDVFLREPRKSLY